MSFHYFYGYVSSFISGSFEAIEEKVRPSLAVESQTKNY